MKIHNKIYDIKIRWKSEKIAVNRTMMAMIIYDMEKGLENCKKKHFLLKALPNGIGRSNFRKYPNSTMNL